MALQCHLTPLPGVCVYTPEVHADARGIFMETFHVGKYLAAGVAELFVQDNFSRSCRGTLRGLHYQVAHAQSKLIMALRGEIFDVAVDIRRGSPTFGRWAGEILSEDNHRQMFVPKGFAHGFCVLSDGAEVLYKCTDFYAPEDDYGVLWSDPDLGIDWPIQEPLLSVRDGSHQPLKRVPEALLPVYAEEA